MGDLWRRAGTETRDAIAEALKEAYGASPGRANVDAVLAAIDASTPIPCPDVRAHIDLTGALHVVKDVRIVHHGFDLAVQIDVDAHVLGANPDKLSEATRFAGRGVTLEISEAQLRLGLHDVLTLLDNDPTRPPTPQPIHGVADQPPIENSTPPDGQDADNARERLTADADSNPEESGHNGLCERCGGAWNDVGGGLLVCDACQVEKWV